MITDENYFSKYCHNNWKSKKLNYIYHFEVDTIAISDDVINNFNKWECYYEMQRDIVKAQNNAPRHRRVESKDDNSCLRSLSINVLADKTVLIAHFRSQNEAMREYDKIYLSNIARALKIHKVMVNVEEYQYNEKGVENEIR